jgi:hypothetical protein
MILVIDEYLPGLLGDKYLTFFDKYPPWPFLRQVSTGHFFDEYQQDLLIDKYLSTSSLPSFQGRYFPAHVSRLTIFFRFDFVHQG